MRSRYKKVLPEGLDTGDSSAHLFTSYREYTVVSLRNIRKELWRGKGVLVSNYLQVGSSITSPHTVLLF